jgi:hypothetical protein
MTLRQIMLLGLLSVTPAILQNAMAQGPQPQSAQQLAALSPSLCGIAA